MNTANQLSVGKEYALETFYGFKRNPHISIYLGEVNFRDLKREFFKGRELVCNDIRYYYLLREPEISGEINLKTGLLLIRSNLKDLEIGTEDEEQYEFIFNVDKKNHILDACSPSKGEMKDGEEKSELIKILRNSGEEL